MNSLKDLKTEHKPLKTEGVSKTRKKTDTQADSYLTLAQSILDRFIKERGLRHTPERTVVLEAIITHQGRFTIDDISDELKGSDFKVCRGTVVNTVRTLVEAGLALKVSTSGRREVYQLMPKSGLKNDGVSRISFGIATQCINCGTIKEVRDRAATAALSSRRFSAFTPTGGFITIYGLCSKCNTKEKSKKTNK